MSFFLVLANDKIIIADILQNNMACTRLHGMHHLKSAKFVKDKNI